MTAGIYLVDGALGRVDLECEPDGYIVDELVVGGAEVRRVERPRALGDGTDNRTRYLGGRVVTASILLDRRKFRTQQLLDRLGPFVSPRFRPRLVYRLDRDGPASEQRSILVAPAESGPLVVQGRRYDSITLQWISVRSVIESIEPRIQTVTPVGDTEAGRTYDLTFDRTYPPTLPSGSATITTLGNSPVDWIANISSSIEDPRLTINDHQVRFDPLVLAGGQFVEINTERRTILRNGDPGDPIQHLTNFTEWEWDDLRLWPGDNFVRYQGNNITDSSATFRWRDGWLL